LSDKTLHKNQINPDTIPSFFLIVYSTRVNHQSRSLETQSTRQEVLTVHRDCAAAHQTSQQGAKSLNIDFKKKEDRLFSPFTGPFFLLKAFLIVVEKEACPFFS